MVSIALLDDDLALAERATPASAAPAETSATLVAKDELTRYVRSHITTHLVDDSAVVTPEGTAIYALSDPRDIRQIRYVGQTSSPRRRFLQHLNTARLWLPDEIPWWVASPKLRPLYQWLRELYRDERRLPMMIVSAWAETTQHARVLERSRIFECLGQQLPLLNFEAELNARQMTLL